MRGFILILFLIPVIANAQISIGVYGSSEKFLSFDIGYIHKSDGFYLGYGHELKFPKGKRVSQILSNYGQDLWATGIYRTTIDLGYSRILSKLISIKGIISFGNKTEFKSYYDKRFTAGGYYVTNNIQNAVGGGGVILFNITDHVGASAGYNSIKEGEGGIFIKF